MPVEVSHISREYAYNSVKIVVLEKGFNEKYYICHIKSDGKIIIFECLEKTCAEIVNFDVDETFYYLILKIRQGYKITNVLKSRSGYKSIKNDIFEKYRKLLISHYGNGNTALDIDFKNFLKYILFDDADGLKVAMDAINGHFIPF